MLPLLSSVCAFCPETFGFGLSGLSLEVDLANQGPGVISVATRPATAS